MLNTILNGIQTKFRIILIQQQVDVNRLYVMYIISIHFVTLQMSLKINSAMNDIKSGTKNISKPMR